MFGYEHERVCFARIGECDGGMYATIMVAISHVTLLSDVPVALARARKRLISLEDTFSH